MTTDAVETFADFAAYVEERRPALLRAAWAITRDPSTAEDLLHSALLTVLPRWQELRHRGAADAYVRRAMINRHHSVHRQPRQRHETPVAELPERRAPVAGPEGLVADRDLGRALWALVRDLPTQQRAAVVLRHYESLSVSETAQVLGIGIGAVRSNTSRGLATLRRRAALSGLDLAG